MWFLIKTAFWFAVVLMLLPPADPGADGRHPQAEIGAAVSAAGAAIEARARDGARIAYRMLDTRLPASKDVITGTVRRAAAALAPQAQETAASVPVPMPAPPRPAAAGTAVAGTGAGAGKVYLPRPYSPPIR